MSFPKTEDSFLRNRPYLWAIVAGMVGLAGFLILLGISLNNEYEHSVEQAKTEVENISQVLDEHVKTTVKSIDLVLLDVIGHLQPADMLAMPGQAGTRSGEIARLLKAKMANASQASVLNVFNAQGALIYSDTGAPPGISIADRAHFKKLRDTPSIGLLVSEPVYSRTTGKFSVVLARRVNFADGRFAGSINAVLDLDYFQQFYRSIDLGPHGTVVLRDEKLRLLARFPPSTELMGKLVPGHHAAPYTAKGLQKGIYIARGQVDGIERLYSFRKVDQLPLIVFAGKATEDYLAEWRASVKSALAGTALLVMFVATLFVLSKRGIAEQRRAELALQRSEARLTAAQRIAHIGSWELDLVTNALLWSDEIYRIFEIDPTRFGASYEAFLDKIHPDDRSMVNQAYTESVSNHTPYNIVHRLLFPDGRIKYVNEQCETFYDQEGKPLRSLGTVQDITESKLAEERAHTASHYARSLIEASLDPLATISNEGIITDVNATFEAATGLTREELVGTDFAAYFTEPEKAREGYRKAFSENMVKDYPLAIRHASGKVMDVLYNATIYRNEAGEVQGVFAAARDITERKRAEDELRESEERFRDVIEHAPIGMAIATPEGRFVQVNRALCEIVGYAADELLQMTFEDITHPDDLEKDLAQVRRLEAGEIPAYEIEKRYLHKNGSIVWAQLTGSVLRDSQGKPLQIIKQVHNITDRKRAEEQLRAASRYARSLIEASLDPLATISNEGIITDVNAAFELAAGVAREDLIGTNFAHYFTEPDKAREGYLKVFSENMVRDYPLAIRHVSGKVMDVLYNATVFRNEAGEVQGVFAAARDITERKHAEDALRESEERLRTLADFTYDWEYWQGPNHEMWFVTPSCERITGYSREEFLAKPDLVNQIIHPDDRPLMEAHLRQTEHEDSSILDFRIVRKDGEIRWIAHGCRAVYWHGGKYMGRRSSNRDITERKSLEMELNELNQDLERRVEAEVAKNREKDHILIQQSRLAAMGEMVHNIAHQWRQPLNALSIILSNIKDDYDYHELTGEALEGAVTRARQLLQRMSTTVDDFRDFFRPDREPGEFDMSQSVEDALFVMEASLKNNNIQVDKNLPKGLMAYGYSNQFAQTILNVFANAKEAIQQHKVSDGRIQVSLSRSGDKGVLSIQDNGGGIPEEVLPKIFDPYFTTKEKGSGIGLYMSKMIIERNLNGTITIASDGPGALVTVTLPLLSPAE